MTFAGPDHISDFATLPRIPAWVTSARAEAIEDVAFLSGAALNHLHLVLGREEVPLVLLRDRLALRAAEACVAYSGRPERAGELRDAVQFLLPGDHPGPAGEVYLSWRRVVERPVSVKTLYRALPAFEAEQIGAWLDVGQGMPVTRAAAVLEAVLVAAPRAEGSALIVAEAALAQACGWDHLVPLLAAGLNRTDLRKRGGDLRLACHRAVAASTGEAVPLALDLARRAAHLNAVSPQLRAKGAGEAVGMFLTRDVVAPAALPLPDRAARRLCDRLVDLGAVRELTGRDTFRLYGV
ncbi:hypothetical protein RA2_03569 [Roseovarius sp. A-2]|uniref:DUF1403 family protein n=1 Tax=Roseovarius sp. A-2 TaxID=1570360 RepID=UPI0009B53317|nr:DUF1403 family protein [Roseovarius sp. A-2]MAM41078.1 DUF1403 domain-containing protein [Erythrobacter sp.]GAW36498.1 hypothetical protein RA2_03569 [Roseovarius sp. A-2]